MQMKKESAEHSFTYIDVFFLLLAGLILSFGAYLFTEHRAQQRKEPIEISLSAYVEKELWEAIPEAGEPIYNENGEIYGTVLSVEREETGGALLLRLTCKMEGVTPQMGEEMRIETPWSIRSMWVYEISEGKENVT